MTSPARKSSSSSSKAPLSNQHRTSKTSNMTLSNIHDDVLQIMLQRLTIKQLLEIYRTNTAFSEKRLVIEMEVVDLSNIIITKTIINFIEKVLDKSKIRKLILNKTRFRIEGNREQFSGNTKIFENVKELQIKDTRIDDNANYFLKKYLNIEDIKSLKIRRLILDNISFVSDKDFEDFNYNIEYYQNLEELIISNFNSIEGKGNDPDTINYFNELHQPKRKMIQNYLFLYILKLCFR